MASPDKYNDGEVVWVKNPNYPWWPGKISSIEDGIIYATNFEFDEDGEETIFRYEAKHVRAWKCKNQEGLIKKGQSRSGFATCLERALEYLKRHPDKATIEVRSEIAKRSTPKKSKGPAAKKSKRGRKPAKSNQTPPITPRNTPGGLDDSDSDDDLPDLSSQQSAQRRSIQRKDVVWAKAKGYPWWPARVRQVGSYADKAIVKYFNDKRDNNGREQAKVEPWSCANSKKYREVATAGADTERKRDLRQAIKDADRYLITSQIKDDVLSHNPDMDTDDDDDLDESDLGSPALARSRPFIDLSSDDDDDDTVESGAEAAPASLSTKTTHAASTSCSTTRLTRTIKVDISLERLPIGDSDPEDAPVLTEEDEAILDLRKLIKSQIDLSVCKLDLDAILAEKLPCERYQLLRKGQLGPLRQKIEYGPLTGMEDQLTRLSNWVVKQYCHKNDNNMIHLVLVPEAIVSFMAKIWDIDRQTAASRIEEREWRLTSEQERDSRIIARNAKQAEADRDDGEVDSEGSD